MPFYIYLILFIIIIYIFHVIRMFIQSRENIPMALFIKALKEENSGSFEEAIISYENALGKFVRINYRGSLKNRITEKLKILHTVTEYRKNANYGR
jgi:hypothetical protein